MERISKESLVKEILEIYYKTGKTVAEIARELAPKFETYRLSERKSVLIDEEYLFRLTQSTISLAKKKLSPNDLEQINQNRSNLQQAALIDLKLEIANDVRNFYIELSGKENDHKAFNDAINAVANRKGINKDIVKNYTVEVFPYLHKSKDEIETPEYYVAFAERILENDTDITVASKMSGYYRMRDFIKANRPELHEKLEELSENHTAKTRKQLAEKDLYSKTNFFKSNAKDLLAQIILTFRVPVELIVQFINTHADLFLEKTDKIDSQQLIKLKQALPQMEFFAINFLFAENMKEFEEYRIAKFNFFVAQLDLLANDKEKQIRFIKSETKDSIASVLEKTKEHVPGEAYNFTQEDIRNILKYVYKYALSNRFASNHLGIIWFDKQDLLKRLDITDSADDQILVKGLAQLSQFNQEAIGYPKR